MRTVVNNGLRLILLMSFWVTQTAQAHGGPGHEHGVVLALLHPFQYWDHFLTLIAVCLLLFAALWLAQSVRKTAHRVLLQFGSVSVALLGIVLLS